MRTTVTLDPDVDQLIKASMKERGLSFKAALNAAVRAGLTTTPGRRYQTPTGSMGYNPEVPWDKALRLAGELEDIELIRKMVLGK